MEGIPGVCRARIMAPWLRSALCVVVCRLLAALYDFVAGNLAVAKRCGQHRSRAGRPKTLAGSSWRVGHGIYKIETEVAHMQAAPCMNLATTGLSA